MQIRNPAYNAKGGIDAELWASDFGWVPFSLFDGDAGWNEAVAMNPAPYPIANVTPAQIRLVLYREGLLDQVQALTDSDPEASIVWEYATTIYRNSPFIEALKDNFTDEQIDQLFATAAEIL